MNSKVMMVPVETRVGYYGDGTLKFNWNDDIVMEILPRLPAKSIARFKVVCKGWLSFLSSEKFRRRHTLCRPKLQPSLILKMLKSQFFYFNPIMKGEKLIRPFNVSAPNKIACSCNGLMLVKSEDPEPSFYMYNPATKQSREIRITDPYTHSVNGRPYIVMVALAFDPSKSPDYKIVCIRCTTKAGTNPYVPHTYQIEVYDSESRTWKLTLGPIAFPRMIFFSDGGVYCNGSIYWDISHDICCYDIAKNEFKTLPLPKYPSMQSRSQTMMMFVSPTYLQEVCDDRCWWLLKYHEVISRHQPTGGLGFAQQLRFIKGSYGSQTETSILVFLMAGKIIAYNFLDKTSKVLVDLSDLPFNKKEAKEFNLQWYEFGESLALV